MPTVKLQGHFLGIEDFSSYQLDSERTNLVGYLVHHQKPYLEGKKSISPVAEDPKELSEYIEAEFIENFLCVIEIEDEDSDLQYKTEEAHTEIKIAPLECSKPALPWRHSMGCIPFNSYFTSGSVVDESTALDSFHEHLLDGLTFK